jgi:micrococcal nuclease
MAPHPHPPSGSVAPRMRSAAGPVLVALALALALVLVLLPAGACGLLGAGDRGRPVDPAAGEAVVTRVVDGDTIVAHLGDEDETVRLLGIDTPETKKPNSPIECFGPEAAAQLAELLPEGTVVRLERDVDERDRYGRLLAYVHRSADDLFVNNAMAAGGFATGLRIPPNVARTAELAEAATAARSAGLGLWGRCGGGHEPLPP